MSPSDSNANNPYTSPQSYLKPIPGWRRATLLDRGWLHRKIQLSEPPYSIIEYNGRGFGFESISVDGAIAIRDWAFFWFVPRFEFFMRTATRDFAATVDVQVRPWLTIARISIRIEGEEVYSEPEHTASEYA